MKLLFIALLVGGTIWLWSTGTRSETPALTPAIESLDFSPIEAAALLPKAEEWFPTGITENNESTRDWTEFRRIQAERNPSSLPNQVDYAQALISRGEYEAARRTLERASEIDSTDKRGAYLRELLEKVANVGSSRSKKLTAQMGLLDLPSEQLPSPELDFFIPEGKTREEVGEEARLANERTAKELREKYRSFSPYELQTGEWLQANLIEKYGESGDWQGASIQFSQLSSRYPSSPAIPALYAKTLIGGGQFHEAFGVIHRAQNQFPSDMRLAVIADILKARDERQLSVNEVSLELSHHLGLLGLY